jgi:hypothetical protein
MLKSSFTFLLFNIFFITYFHAQKVEVQDSINGKPISYAEFQIDGSVFFADSLGQFNFTKNYKSFVVYKPGFLPKTINKFSNLIKLSPKTYEIQEVVLKKYNLKSIDSKIKKNNTWILPFGLQIGFKYYNPYHQEGIIKKITIPIKQIYDNKNAVLSIRFYKYSGDEIEIEPIENGVIEISVDQLKRKKNTIDISENGIILPENGVFISLNVIEENGTDFFKGSKQSIRFYNSKTIGNSFFLNTVSKKWVKNSIDFNIIGISFEAAF